MTPSAIKRFFENAPENADTLPIWLELRTIIAAHTAAKPRRKSKLSPIVSAQRQQADLKGQILAVLFTQELPNDVVTDSVAVVLNAEISCTRGLIHKLLLYCFTHTGISGKLEVSGVQTAKTKSF
jgi:hypothetical protein